MAAVASSLVTFDRRGPGRTVVWLRGDHDASTAESLADTLARAIAFEDGDVVIDLSGVTFLGAAPARLIARTRRFLDHRSRVLTLRSPPTSTLRILEWCGLSDLLDGDVMTAALAVSRVEGAPRQSTIDVGAIARFGGT